MPFDVAEVMAWRERMLVFNDVPLATVIDEINRYRPGMLLLLDKALGRRRVRPVSASINWPTWRP